MWEDLEFKNSIKELQKAGPSGHILAHITPEEATLLKAFGGSGKINPNTKLHQFDWDTAGDWGDPEPDDWGDWESGDTQTGAYEYGGNYTATTSTQPDWSDLFFGSSSGDNNTSSGNFTTGSAHGDAVRNRTNASGDSSEERRRRREAAAAAAEAARQAELARLKKVGEEKKSSLRDLLKTQYEGLDYSGYSDAFKTSFADDIMEDYAAAQKGLDEAYLTSSNYEDFHGEKGGLGEQQTGLTGFLEEEQSRLDQMATDYASGAQRDASDWYRKQLDKISSMDLADPDSFDPTKYDFTELDMSAYLDPTKASSVQDPKDNLFNPEGAKMSFGHEGYDPEFFKDYSKVYKDAEESYFGSGADPTKQDLHDITFSEGGTIRNAINPATGLPYGTTVAQGPPDWLWQNQNSSRQVR